MEDSPRQLMKNLINRSLTSIDSPRHVLCLQRTKGLQFLSLPWRKELHELHSKSPGKESMFGAFFIGVDSFFNMCRVAAPNVEVEHLYSCIHFCGIAAGSSVFVRKKNTRVDVSPVEESDGRTWTYHQPPSPGMAWNSRPFKRRCGGKDLW